MRRLVELLATDLKGVEFPGFGPKILEQATEALHARAEAVHQARQKLQEASAELEQARISLLRLAEQGLAYLRVYAMNETELLDKLAAIKLEPGRHAPPRQRKPSKPREPSVVHEHSSPEPLGVSVQASTN